jgi:hypothetical protein
MAVMQDSMVSALRSRRPQIRVRWEELLRIERASTPLANPDSLVHLLDWTLDEFFQALHCLPARRRSVRPVSAEDCPCGRNPLLAYFTAGEQALRESLVLAQAETKDLSPHARDSALDELDLAFRAIARHEVESFCGVCQYRKEGTVATSGPSSAVITAG